MKKTLDNPDLTRASVSSLGTRPTCIKSELNGGHVALSPSPWPGSDLCWTIAGFTAQMSLRFYSCLISNPGFDAQVLDSGLTEDPSQGQGKHESAVDSPTPRGRSSIPLSHWVQPFTSMGPALDAWVLLDPVTGVTVSESRILNAADMATPSALPHTHSTRG